jgi:hypothetical protein
VHLFGIKKPDKEGRPQYGALGGAAMLNERGKKYLEETYGASQFEADSDTGYFDARFVVDEKQLEEVLALFENILLSNIYEQSMTLDIAHELVSEGPGVEKPILSMEEVVQCIFVHVGCVRQRSSDASADSLRAKKASIPTRRIFRIFELVMPEGVYGKFVESPSVRFLSPHDVISTKGGSQAGSTLDGTAIIQNNLF